MPYPVQNRRHCHIVKCNREDVSGVRPECRVRDLPQQMRRKTSETKLVLSSQTPAPHRGVLLPDHPLPSIFPKLVRFWVDWHFCDTHPRPAASARSVTCCGRRGGYAPIEYVGDSLTICRLEAIGELRGEPRTVVQDGKRSYRIVHAWGELPLTGNDRCMYRQ